ncbi:hypothetical protein FHA45_19035 [Escherichia coli]|nr:hypothetical protein [Escherichia coli]
MAPDDKHDLISGTCSHLPKGGYMDGPGGGITPVNINGTVWFQGDGCKTNTCGWDFIVTLYNPKTHEVVGYRYFGLGKVRISRSFLPKLTR